MGEGTAKVTVNCHCGTTAITDAATKCKYCLASDNYVGVGSAIAACTTTDGTAGHATKPNSCKCGASACAFGKFCLSASATNRCRSGTITGVACSSSAGTAAVTADCICGTAGLALAGKFCIAAATAANTAAAVNNAALANCAGIDGNTAVAAGVACKCGPATGGRSNDICTVGQFCNAAEAGTGNSGANGKCRTTALPAPSPTPPAPAGSTTIAQKITFSGTQASYAAVKTFSEQAYGKALDIFDTTLTTPAYKTGCSVTSVASAPRRAYAVTFTATTSASTGAAANTAATALTSTSYGNAVA